MTEEIKDGFPGKQPGLTTTGGATTPLDAGAAGAGGTLTEGRPSIAPGADGSAI